MKQFIFFIFSCSSAFAADLTINTSSGEDYFLEVAPQDTFQEVINTLQTLENSTAREGLHITLNVQKNRIEAKTKSKPSVAPSLRSYQTPLTPKDRENITYLLTTLANQHPVKLLFKRSSLDEVGAQIAHIHPGAFLRFVFTNDELIVAMRVISKSSLIWSDVSKPIVDSIASENWTPEQIKDLANAVKIDANLISIPIRDGDAKAVLDNMIQYVPRSGNAKHYNM